MVENRTGGDIGKILKRKGRTWKEAEELTMNKNNWKKFVKGE